MNKLYCVRHGETDWNVKNIMQGRTDVLLNEKGMSQAYELKNKIDLSKIDLCLCSPLKRTLETARIIIEDRIPIICDNMLVERSFGDLEGHTYDEEMMLRHWDYNLNSNEYGIETLRDCLNRAKKIIDMIKIKYHDKNILIVSHGCFIKVLYYVINGYDDKTDFMTFFPKNGDIVEFNI